MDWVVVICIVVLLDDEKDQTGNTVRTMIFFMFIMGYAFINKNCLLFFVCNWLDVWLGEAVQHRHDQTCFFSKRTYIPVLAHIHTVARHHHVDTVSNEMMHDASR
jgi:hypothetical protein